MLYVKTEQGTAEICVPDYSAKTTIKGCIWTSRKNGQAGDVFESTYVLRKGRR